MKHDELIKKYIGIYNEAYDSIIDLMEKHSVVRLNMEEDLSGRKFGEAGYDEEEAMANFVWLGPRAMGDNDLWVYQLNLVTCAGKTALDISGIDEHRNYYGGLELSITEMLQVLEKVEDYFTGYENNKK